jgi:hypothetical protein
MKVVSGSLLCTFVILLYAIPLFAGNITLQTGTYLSNQGNSNVTIYKAYNNKDNIHSEYLKMYCSSNTKAFSKSTPKGIFREVKSISAGDRVCIDVISNEKIVTLCLGRHLIKTCPEFDPWPDEPIVPVNKYARTAHEF